MSYTLENAVTPWYRVFLVYNIITGLVRKLSLLLWNPKIP
jgi:hypothetical protein